MRANNPVFLEKLQEAGEALGFESKSKQLSRVCGLRFRQDSSKQKHEEAALAGLSLPHKKNPKGRIWTGLLQVVHGAFQNRQRLVHVPEV